MWLRKLPHHSTQIKGISKWLHECWTPHCSFLTGEYDMYKCAVSPRRKTHFRCHKTDPEPDVTTEKTENCTIMKQEGKRRRQRKIERLTEIFARKTDERVVSPERRTGQIELLTGGGATGLKWKQKIWSYWLWLQISWLCQSQATGIDQTFMGSVMKMNWRI